MQKSKNIVDKLAKKAIQLSKILHALCIVIEDLLDLFILYQVISSTQGYQNCNFFLIQFKNSIIIKNHTYTNTNNPSSICSSTFRKSRIHFRQTFNFQFNQSTLHSRRSINQIMLLIRNNKWNNFISKFWCEYRLHMFNINIIEYIY